MEFTLKRTQQDELAKEERAAKRTIAAEERAAKTASNEAAITELRMHQKERKELLAAKLARAEAKDAELDAKAFSPYSFFCTYYRNRCRR